MTAALPWVDGPLLRRLVGWREAIAVVEDALLGGLDPSAAPLRSVVDVSSGQLLLMPAESAAGVGVKVAAVAPGNPDRGLPRIQAVYVLLDRSTLTPLALLDGTSLTAVRTPAVSAVAVAHLAAPSASRLVAFGSGPQAEGHVLALSCVRPVTEVTVVGRNRARAEVLVQRLAEKGVRAATGTSDAVAGADLVVCATTASEPVFDGRLLHPEACVVAVGSHEPTARELDDTTMGRAARVVVEDVEVAMREAGDVVQAVTSGVVRRDALIGLADAVGLEPSGGISVFKSVGMGWEDLVVAQAAHRRLLETGDA